VPDDVSLIWINYADRAARNPVIKTGAAYR